MYSLFFRYFFFFFFFNDTATTEIYTLSLHDALPIASEILELLLAGTGAREVLAARAGGLQSLSNLAKLSRTLRARQSSRTFSEVMELVKAMDQAGQEESESRIMEERSDAVRVLTVHRAKGLDFGIVFVAGLGLRRVGRACQFFADH